MAQQYEPLIDDKFTTKRNIQVNSDWNATSGKGQILNKPDLSIYTQGVSLGNILFVSNEAPLINDTQNRNQAVGKNDKPFKSIQNAINIANEGDVIYVFAGTYNGFTVNNPNFFNCTIILENVIVNGNFSISSQYGLNKTFNLIGVGVSKITGNIILPNNSNFLIDNLEFNDYVANITTLGKTEIKNSKINYLSLNGNLSNNLNIYNSDVNLVSIYRFNCNFYNCKVIIPNVLGEGQFNKMYFENCNIFITAPYLCIEYYPPQYEFVKCKISANQFMQLQWGKAGNNPLILKFCILNTSQIFVQNQIFSLIANYVESNYDLTSVTPNTINIQNYNVII